MDPQLFVASLLLAVTTATQATPASPVSVLAKACVIRKGNVVTANGRDVTRCWKRQHRHTRAVSDQLSVTEGDSVYASCSVSGTRIPFVRWQLCPTSVGSWQDQCQLLASGALGSAELNISSIQLLDAGMFQCVGRLFDIVDYLWTFSIEVKSANVCPVWPWVWIVVAIVLSTVGLVFSCVLLVILLHERCHELTSPLIILLLTDLAVMAVSIALLIGAAVLLGQFPDKSNILEEMETEDLTEQIEAWLIATVVIHAVMTLFSIVILVCIISTKSSKGVRSSTACLLVIVLVAIELFFTAVTVFWTIVIGQKYRMLTVCNNWTWEIFLIVILILLLIALIVLLIWFLKARKNCLGEALENVRCLCPCRCNCRCNCPKKTNNSKSDRKRKTSHTPLSKVDVENNDGVEDTKSAADKHSSKHKETPAVVPTTKGKSNSGSRSDGQNGGGSAAKRDSSSGKLRPMETSMKPAEKTSSLYAVTKENTDLFTELDDKPNQQGKQKKTKKDKNKGSERL